jgi:hypothetical protein
MSQRTSTSSIRGRAGTGASLVAASAFLLSGLAIADRSIAWMIGQFPTSAMLWELRFEYLRPIGVFHDIAARYFGGVGVGSFNMAAALAGLLVALGAVSGIRLARALSSHALLAAALVVAVSSFNPGEGIYAMVGVPSAGYELIGLLVAAGAMVMCAASHCDYLGWTPNSSRVVRRLRIDALRLGSQLSDRAAEAFAQAFPKVVKARTILVRARRAGQAR